MTIVEKVRDICRAKRIPISRLEQDLHFSNGYLNPKKARDVSGSRLVEIAEYLGVSVSRLLGEENEKTALPEEDGDLAEIREAIKENPALRALFDASMGVPASRIYEAAAQLARWKEGDRVDS